MTPPEWLIRAFLRLYQTLRAPPRLPVIHRTAAGARYPLSLFPICGQGCREVGFHLQPWNSLPGPTKAEGDQRFESISLQGRVRCEPHSDCVKSRIERIPVRRMTRWRGDRARLGTCLPRRDPEPAYPVGRARGSRTVCTAKWRLHVTSHAPDGRGLGRRVSPSAGWQLRLPRRISTRDFTSARH